MDYQIYQYSHYFTWVVDLCNKYEITDKCLLLEHMNSDIELEFYISSNKSNFTFDDYKKFHQYIINCSYNDVHIFKNYTIEMIIVLLKNLKKSFLEQFKSENEIESKILEFNKISHFIFNLFIESNSKSPNNEFNILNDIINIINEIDNILYTNADSIELYNSIIAFIDKYKLYEILFYISIHQFKSINELKQNFINKNEINILDLIKLGGRYLTNIYESEFIQSIIQYTSNEFLHNIFLKIIYKSKSIDNIINKYPQLLDKNLFYHLSSNKYAKSILLKNIDLIDFYELFKHGENWAEDIIQNNFEMLIQKYQQCFLEYKWAFYILNDNIGCGFNMSKIKFYKLFYNKWFIDIYKGCNRNEYNNINPLLKEYIELSKSNLCIFNMGNIPEFIDERIKLYTPEDLIPLLEHQITFKHAFNRINEINITQELLYSMNIYYEWAIPLLTLYIDQIDISNVVYMDNSKTLHLLEHNKNKLSKLDWDILSAYDWAFDFVLINFNDSRTDNISIKYVIYNPNPKAIKYLKLHKNEIKKDYITVLLRNKGIYSSINLDYVEIKQPVSINILEEFYKPKYIEKYLDIKIKEAAKKSNIKNQQSEIDICELLDNYNPKIIFDI